MAARVLGICIEKHADQGNVPGLIAPLRGAVKRSRLKQSYFLATSRIAISCFITFEQSPFHVLVPKQSCTWR